MTRPIVVHRGCVITWSPELYGWFWESETWGWESDRTFRRVEDAQADIDRVLDAPAPTDIDIEAALAARNLENLP